MNTHNLQFRLAGFGLLAGLILGVTGCQSFKQPLPGCVTSLTITNQPMAAVQSAVTAVFATHGFDGGQSGANQFTYTRFGSRMNNLAYGNSMFDEVVTVKVRVTLQQQTPQTIALGCNAWLIEAADDPVFQDSHQVRPLRRWPYEQLLKDVQAQLGQ